MPAPYTLGISEEACKQVGGTWCRRPCYALQRCIRDKPKRDKCRVASQVEISGTPGTWSFQLTHSDSKCDNDDKVYMIITAEGPSAEPSSMPSLSSMPSSMPSSAPSSMPLSFEKSRVLVEEFSAQNITDIPPPEVAGSESFASSYGQATTTSITNNDDEPSPSLAPDPCKVLPFTFTYKITYAESAASNATDARTPKKIITNFVKGRNGKQTELYTDLGDDEKEITFGADRSLIITTAENITICNDDSVYKR